MGTASLIRNSRLALGLAERDVADRLGLPIAAYGDLESFDDELATAISLTQARELARTLRVALVDLLGLKPTSLPRVSIRQAAELLHEKGVAAGRTVDDLEEDVGWSLAEFMADPVVEAGEEPIDFLQDLAQYLHVDLHGLLDGDAA